MSCQMIKENDSWFLPELERGAVCGMSKNNTITTGVSQMFGIFLPIFCSGERQGTCRASVALST